MFNDEIVLLCALCFWFLLFCAYYLSGERIFKKKPVKRPTSLGRLAEWVFEDYVESFKGIPFVSKLRSPIDIKLTPGCFCISEDLKGGVTVYMHYDRHTYSLYATTFKSNGPVLRVCPGIIKTGILIREEKKDV